MSSLIAIHPRKPVANRSPGVKRSICSDSRSPGRTLKRLDEYFWYKANDGVDRLATSSSTLSEVPRNVNDYIFDARWFATYRYPTTFPPGAPWPPRTAQDVMHALGRAGDDCVGDLCYTSTVCGNPYCTHTFEDWKRATENWQDHFELRTTKRRGIGVFTKRAFKQEDILGWYAGEIIPGDAGRSENAYLMEVPVGIQHGAEKGARAHKSYDSLLFKSPFCPLASVLIDGDRKGNWTRFINHSCDPDCEFQIRRVGRMRIMVVTATRDIAAGVEVTIHYGPSYWSAAAGRACFCGEKQCAEKSKTEKSKTERNKTERYKTERHKTEKSKIEKNKTEKSKIEKNKTEKSKIEKNKTEKSKIEKNKAERNNVDMNKKEKSKVEREARQETQPQLRKRIKRCPRAAPP